MILAGRCENKLSGEKPSVHGRPEAAGAIREGQRKIQASPRQPMMRAISLWTFSGAMRSVMTDRG